MAIISAVSLGSAGLSFEQEIGTFEEKFLPFMALKNFQTLVIGVLALRLERKHDQDSSLAFFVTALAMLLA